MGAHEVTESRVFPRQGEGSRGRTGKEGQNRQEGRVGGKVLPSARCQPSGGCRGSTRRVTGDVLWGPFEEVEMPGEQRPAG